MACDVNDLKFDLILKWHDEGWIVLGDKAIVSDLIKIQINVQHLKQTFCETCDTGSKVTVSLNRELWVETKGPELSTNFRWWCNFPEVK